MESHLKAMDEHYRRLHYEAAQCWTQSAPVTRLKRPIISKKRKDSKFIKDKYGSVSAQSTSAIYGALRAPHYYAPSNMWYASIRSLNPRDLIYPYQWREPAYEDVTKEVFAPPVVAGSCACITRRRPLDGLKQRQIPKCMYCIKSYGATQLSKKLPDKTLEEKRTVPSSRMTGYKKCVPGHLKYGTPFNKGATKDFSRKSILECDVTAYDLIKKVVKVPSTSEIDDSDLDDNLCDSVIAKINEDKYPSNSLSNHNQVSQNENSIYNESSSVLVCGQRIFTHSQNHRSKSPTLIITSSHHSENPSCSKSWRSASSDSICIPDPDYDDSDESDVETVIKYRNPKFTYSPPPFRNSFDRFQYCNKELSKSMSSLLSDDTYVSNINNTTKTVKSKINSKEEIVPSNELPVSSVSPPNSIQLYESSSDSGTLSSEYPTWTSNELKSILKRRGDNIIQMQEDCLIDQKKKQVQFIGTKFVDQLVDGESVINCDTYETIADIFKEKSFIPSHDNRGKIGAHEQTYPLVRSSSFEDIKDQTHLSFCGRNSRSLPDSPTQLNFSFDFPPKEMVFSSSKSTFYVPVEDHLTEKEPCDKLLIVLPCTVKNEQESKEHYDNDDGNLEYNYENLDPIYEELNDVSSTSKHLGLTSLESNQKSFFEGASKIDILSYLEDAKERGISEGLSEDVIVEEEDEDDKVVSGEEDDVREKQRVITKNDLNHKEVLLTIEEIKTESEEIDIFVEDKARTRISDVERNDSGVGTETSKPSRLKAADWEEQLCADCDHHVEPIEDESSGLLFSPLVCRKCEFRRCERKEIIIEFVDTELKYGRDLRIIKEEFYRPMEIAGLLAKEQLNSIFLNLDELIIANAKFSEKLQDTLDIAMEHGDEDYTTVNLGKLFLECSSMMHAFETYCVKQASASVLLSGLEKEKELLRIFLRVSQMENTLLRRMNLPAFLMVPVQRVTRYPLLLSRLHKVTPIHHKDGVALKEAQQKVELHLEHINQQTKGVGGTKIWRRISNISASHRRLGKDIGSIKLRKVALEVLNWKQDETRFVIAGNLFFTQITDYPWNKKGKFTCVHALLIALGKPNSNYKPELENVVLFPRNTGIRDASLVLMKEKNGRFLITRDPLYLGNCVISCESENDDVFEMQEYTTKDSYVIKGETKKDTKEWLQMLRYHAKDLGSWRKRRNALANIMINGMIRQ